MSCGRHIPHQVRVRLPEWMPDAADERFGYADLDEGIAKLIRALWRRGFDTVMSCEGGGHRGWAWIEFATAESARLFVRTVMDSGDELAWKIREPDEFANIVAFPPEMIPVARCRLIERL